MPPTTSPLLGFCLVCLGVLLQCNVTDRAGSLPHPVNVLMPGRSSGLSSFVARWMDAEGGIRCCGSWARLDYAYIDSMDGCLV